MRGGPTTDVYHAIYILFLLARHTIVYLSILFPIKFGPLNPSAGDRGCLGFAYLDLRCGNRPDTLSGSRQIK
jgi:hypothetical protein